MNSIPGDQNDPRRIRYLAAQRHLYGTAKTIFGWQIILSGPITVALAFLTVVVPDVRSYVALWGITATLIDVTWLTPWIRRLKLLAARAQEMFDCEVLRMPWNELKAGKRPDPELVKEQSDRYQSWAAGMPALTDWYAAQVGQLPLHVARVVCQRSNCWWDARQRRRYATIVIILLLVVFATVLIAAFMDDITVEAFVVKVLAPLAPALVLGYRQVTEQLDAASRLDNLKGHSESLWEACLSGEKEPVAAARSRQLQDEIFENRHKSPLVFDILFRWLRSEYEAQMNHAAAEMVADAQKRL
jgi:hypothetical protein